MRENLVLADCAPEEIANLLKGIKDKGVNIECYSVISNEGRKNQFSNFVRYLKYFTVPIRIFKKRKKYDYIVGWQQFYALIFCFWCNLFHVKKVNRVIAMNYTYKDKKGLVGVVYKWFMKRCVCNKYLDYFHVLSNDYADMMAKTFGIDRKRFIVTAFGVDDMMEKYGKCVLPPKAPATKYALAIGRSNRDYDFLINVWARVNEDLVIISDEYKKDDLPENVILINDVSGDAQYPWISNCHFMIIPIDKADVCSGDTVLLTAMSLAKPIFVTSPSTLAEMYVTNGKDAIFISKNVEEAAQIINDFVLNEDKMGIGEAARKTFLEKYSRYNLGKNLSKYMK